MKAICVMIFMEVPESMSRDDLAEIALAYSTAPATSRVAVYDTVDMHEILSIGNGAVTPNDRASDTHLN